MQTVSLFGAGGFRRGSLEFNVMNNTKNAFEIDGYIFKCMDCGKTITVSADDTFTYTDINFSTGSSETFVDAPEKCGHCGIKIFMSDVKIN